MSSFKKGFSLAEVLIALAIVAIIATMAFTISKKSAENAYNMYIYTGYIGISDAIADAAHNKLELEYQNVKNCEAINYIMKVLSVNSSKVTKKTSSDNISFTTPNKINYEIWTAGKKARGEDTSEEISPYFYIKMTVPTARTTSTNQGASICFSYAPKEEWSALIPFQQDALCTTTIADIQKRVDLLPFYIDNGRLGMRTTYNKKEVSEPEPRHYYSFEQAACTLYGDITTFSKNLNCSGVNTSNVKPNKGVLKVANPRKVL